MRQTFADQIANFRRLLEGHERGGEAYAIGESLRNEMEALLDAVEDRIEALGLLDEDPAKPGHPMQPVYLDDNGTARFKVNPIVRFLLDFGPFDLNRIIALPGCTPADHEQFAQLIGYSVGGFAELGYTSDEKVSAAWLQANRLK